MKTRNVTQILIYKLFLHHAQWDFPDLAAISFEEEKLNLFKETLLTDEYDEEISISDEGNYPNMINIKVQKNFKKGSALEAFNLKQIDGLKYGIHTQWINEEDFEKFKQEFPTVPII